MISIMIAIIGEGNVTEGLTWKKLVVKIRARGDQQASLEPAEQQATVRTDQPASQLPTSQRSWPALPSSQTPSNPPADLRTSNRPG